MIFPRQKHGKMLAVTIYGVETLPQNGVLPI